MKSSYIPYQSREDWKDIHPIPDDPKSAQFLEIHYSKECRNLVNGVDKDAIGYFRAIILKNEISQRAYDLSKEIISLSPSCLGTWYKTIHRLGISCRNA